MEFYGSLLGMESTGSTVMTSKFIKPDKGIKITMTNNRVDLLEVDPYNYIWLQTYDYRVYRFDQRTEKFEQIPAEGEEEGMRFSSIKILPDMSFGYFLKMRGLSV